MKYLSAEIPWSNLKAVGFDLDGTLYDEFDFIGQIYSRVAEILVTDPANTNLALDFMLARWLEKGSSYPYIFKETLEQFDPDQTGYKTKIDRALEIFRSFAPTLSLSSRMKFTLQELQNKYVLFLVSNGSPILQRNKISALGLETYFKKCNIFISGDHGKELEKPGTALNKKIECLSPTMKPEEIVFIGDREMDKVYARASGFHFVYIDQLFVKNR
jgi:putative hydrolase of the HAD superfamily